MDISSKLTQFIQEELLENQTQITQDTALFTSGLLDSVDLVELTTFLENEFNIKINEQDIIINNFNTINSMQNFISKKTG